MNFAPNSQILLAATLSDGRTDLFCQATVYNSVGVLVGVVTIPHVALGLYQSTTTIAAVDNYSVLYSFYEDAAFTIASQYQTQSENVSITTDFDEIKRNLALGKDNTILYNCVYDANGDLISASERTYNSAANAAAAFPSPATSGTGLLFEYALQSSFSSPGVLSKFMKTRIL